MSSKKDDCDIYLNAANTPHVLTDFINTNPFQKKWSSDSEILK